jgi:hypothetical protein
VRLQSRGDALPDDAHDSVALQNNFSSAHGLQSQCVVPLTRPVCFLALIDKVDEPILDSLSFKQLSMAFIEICLRNVWFLKIKSAIGPLSVIGASTLAPSWNSAANLFF